MTDDIAALVERLRKRGTVGGDARPISLVLAEAADALERLEKENERLRAALESINRKDWHVGITLYDLQAIARAALESKP